MAVITADGAIAREAERLNCLVFEEPEELAYGGPLEHQRALELAVALSESRADRRDRYSVIIEAQADHPIRPARLFPRLEKAIHTGAAWSTALAECPSHYHPFRLYRLTTGDCVPYCLAPPPINSQDYPPVYIELN